jgi:predicted AAA+ superfamily ATPase
MMVTKLIKRKLETKLLYHLQRGKSVLLLGPRQVGKTTLLSNLKSDLVISFISRRERFRYLKDPEQLQDEIAGLGKKKPLVIIDEVQRVPEIMDCVQDCIDSDQAQFILTGSSARKLKRHVDINLLPGRVVSLRLDPLTIAEYLELPKINDFLLFGMLPAIALQKKLVDSDEDLRSYVEAYLEEEVQREALVRNLGPFVRFLELAAQEAGQIVNFSALASELNIDKNTVASHFEILHDCLITERIEPITKSKTRKKLTKSCRYLFFDMGVRRLAANEGLSPSRERLGQLFEQWVGLELIHQMRLEKPTGHLRFWRDPEGPEVDWVIEIEDQYIPIEVKLTDSPNIKDAKHLITFMHEYPKAHSAYIICQCKRVMNITENVRAIPWTNISSIFK